jgi:hypothetical protein
MPLSPLSEEPLPTITLPLLPRMLSPVRSWALPDDPEITDEEVRRDRSPDEDVPFPVEMVTIPPTLPIPVLDPLRREISPPEPMLFDPATTFTLPEELPRLDPTPIVTSPEEPS